MTGTIDFAWLLAAANESTAKAGRNAGQWTPAAVETWRLADPEMARMLDAAFALELRLGRKAGATHEGLRTYFQNSQPSQLSYSSVRSHSENRNVP
jgi:hypothetical protein